MVNDLCSLRLGDLGDAGKSIGIMDREVREHLAVDLDPGFTQPGHEPAVAQSVEPRGSVDPGDPERPEVTLLLAAVAVGVPHALLDVLLRGLVQLASSLEAALGGLHDLLLACVVRYAALDAWHGRLLSRSEEHTSELQSL